MEICGIRQDVLSDTVKSISAFLQKGQGAPAREPLITDDQHKQMMMRYYKRQEELKVRKRLHLQMEKLKIIFRLLSVLLPDFFFAMFSETRGSG